MPDQPSDMEKRERTAASAGPGPKGAAKGQPPKRGQRAKITLHKDMQHLEDVFVSVNGERFLIQRGVEVEVPDYVAEVLDNSLRQDAAAMAFREKMSRRFERKAKEA